MANKVIVQAIEASRERGLVAQYIVMGPDQSPVTAGSLLLTISHPQECKQMFTAAEKLVAEVLEKQGYMFKPDIKIVGDGNITSIK
jgi:hypothetical protein